MITPRHSFESVVHELRRGLEDGSVVLGAKTGTEQVVAHGWNLGNERGKWDTQVYTFTATVAQQRFLIKHNVTRRLVVTVSGNTVIHVSGDVSEIQSFDIPADLKRGLAELLSDAAASLLTPQSKS